MKEEPFDGFPKCKFAHRNVLHPIDNKVVERSCKLLQAIPDQKGTVGVRYGDCLRCQTLIGEQVEKKEAKDANRTET